MSLEYKWLMLTYRNDMERTVRSRMQKTGTSSIPAGLAVHVISLLFAIPWSHTISPSHASDGGLLTEQGTIQYLYSLIHLGTSLYCI